MNYKLGIKGQLPQKASISLCVNWLYVMSIIANLFRKVTKVKYKLSLVALCQNQDLIILVYVVLRWFIFLND